MKKGDTAWVHWEDGSVYEVEVEGITQSNVTVRYREGVLEGKTGCIPKGEVHRTPKARKRRETNMVQKAKGKKRGRGKNSLQALVVKIFSMARVPKDEDVIARVLKEFPDAKTFGTKSNPLSWYKAKFRKGLLVGQDPAQAPFEIKYRNAKKGGRS